MNDSFELLTSQNLDNFNENSTNEMKKNIENINKNSINLEKSEKSAMSFNVKEKESLIEKIKILEEKNRFVQNEKNELSNELDKKVYYFLKIDFFMKKFPLESEGKGRFQ